CQISSLFFGYLVLSVTYFIQLDGILCLLRGVILSWTFLASFIWLNALSFDFYHMISRRNGDSNDDGAKRRSFIAYNLYAWLTPTIFVGAALWTDQMAPKDSILRPDFQNGCWNRQLVARIVFFYFPISVTLIANIIFYVLAICTLSKYGNEAAFANKSVRSQ